jgi:hypothetical protein
MYVQLRLPLHKERNWLDVDPDNFNDFRCRCYNPSFRTIEACQQMLDYHGYTTVNHPTQQLTNQPGHPLVTFRKGVKRDQSVFPELKQQHQFDNWYCTWKANAIVQAVGEVFDASYKPKSASEKEVFNEQQQYVYAMLNTKLLTEVGQKLVRDYEATYDAQSILCELVADALELKRAPN